MLVLLSLLRFPTFNCEIISPSVYVRLRRLFDNPTMIRRSCINGPESYLSCLIPAATAAADELIVLSISTWLPLIDVDLLLVERDVSP